LVSLNSVKQINIANSAIQHHRKNDNTLIINIARSPKIINLFIASISVKERYKNKQEGGENKYDKT
jgi:hypothetical protein